MSKKLTAMVFGYGLAMSGLWAQGPQVPVGSVEIPLWANEVPATPTGSLPNERQQDAGHVAHVQKPRVWVTLPKDGKNGKPMPMVLLIPGGGYGVVGHQFEGTEVAKYLESQGIASATLLYRCGSQPFPAPLLDARKALAILKERSKDWNVDASQIGVMGFSAGGHLAGMLCSGIATQPESDVATRPSFAVLVYPVVQLRGPMAHAGSGTNLLGAARADAEAGKFALDQLVDSKWPRTYQLHETNDSVVPSKGSEALAESFVKAGIEHELHIVPGRDHGFGWNRPDAKGKVRGPENWLAPVVDWIRRAKP